MEQTFGAVLSALRREREMSLRELGQLTTFSHVYLWQIERGEKRPTVRVAEACDRELRAGGELLTLLTDPSRQPAANPAVLSRDNGLGPTDHARPVAPEEMAHSLWDARARFERLYRETGGISARPRLNEFLRVRAMPLVQAANVHSESLAAISALQGLAAATAHDCLDRAAAEPHARFALVLAQRSARLPMIGYALSIRARFELWAGQPDAAAEHIERALSMGAQFGPVLLGDLHCLRAETQVRSGEPERAREALLESARQLEAADPRTGPAETRYLVPGTLEVRRAEVLRRAGDLDAALDHARVALVIGARGHPRARVHALTVYGRVLADRGDLQRAARTGREALGLISVMESRLLPRRLAALGRACATVDPTLPERAERLLRWLV